MTADSEQHVAGFHHCCLASPVVDGHGFAMEESAIAGRG